MALCTVLRIFLEPLSASYIAYPRLQNFGELLQHPDRQLD